MRPLDRGPERFDPVRVYVTADVFPVFVVELTRGAARDSGVQGGTGVDPRATGLVAQQQADRLPAAQRRAGLRAVVGFIERAAAPLRRSCRVNALRA